MLTRTRSPLKQVNPGAVARRALMLGCCCHPDSCPQVGLITCGMAVSAHPRVMGGWGGFAGSFCLWLGSETVPWGMGQYLQPALRTGYEQLHPCAGDALLL